MVKVLYHANCMDGFCSAWICHLFGVGDEFIPVSHGGPLPQDLSGHNVLIVDFSYPRDILEAMKKCTKSLKVLDHHKTAEEALKGLDYCTFDMNKSGAMLTWEYIAPDYAPRPWIVDYVQDRDLWTHSLPLTKEVNAGLFSYEKDFATWTTLSQLPVEAVAMEGQGILRFQGTLIKNLLKNRFKIKMAGYEVDCVNTPLFQSEVGEALAKENKFGVTRFFNGELWIYSLRSVGDFDVSVIAKEFGGGGHKNASGFQRKDNVS